MKSMEDGSEALERANENNPVKQLHHELFNRHIAIMLIINPLNGRILDANAAAEKFYGWTQDQLRRMKIQEIDIFAEQEIRNETKNVLALSHDHFESQHRLADSSIRDVEVWNGTVVSA